MFGTRGILTSFYLEEKHIIEDDICRLN